MQRETHELIARYYDAFNRKALDEMYECLDENVIHDVNQGAARNGMNAFREFSEHMRKCYDETLTGIVIFTTNDPARAAAEFTVNGRYISDDEGLPRANGQEYQLPAGAFFSINNGKITRVTTYYNLNEWIAQVTK